MAGILLIRHKNPNKQSVIKEQDKFLISKKNEKRQVPVHVNYNGLIYTSHPFQIFCFEVGTYCVAGVEGYV